MINQKHLKMSEVKAIFILDCVDIKIHCKKDEKMKDICQRFATKIKKNINSYAYIYGGDHINFDLNYDEQQTDKNSKEMRILVYKNEDYEYICTKCGDKVKLNKEKIDEIILNNNNIKDKIKGIELMIDMMIKSSLINTMNIQLKNLNVILNTINDDINKNNERLDNLLDNIIIKDNNKYKNTIQGILNITPNDINNDIRLFYTDTNNNIDVYINNEKINVIKDNKDWKYNFKNEGKYTFKIIFNVIISNMRGFFEECSNITSLDFSYFDTSNITDMAWMFNKCHKLEEIKGINRFNTNKVTDMQSMFEKCNELEYLDLSNFDTSNVTKMNHMFNECHKLKEIKGINKFKTNKVTNMYAMFNECLVLEYLDLSNFDTSNVTNMVGMFNSCNKLKYLNLLNFTINCDTELMLNFENNKNCQFITNNKDLLELYNSS